MTKDELQAERAAVGARYADLARELMETRVELTALDHILGSPIAGGHFQGEFTGDINDLPMMLAHPVFSPYRSRRLSGQVNDRVTELAENIKTT
jgi:hypothetical protein